MNAYSNEKNATEEAENEINMRMMDCTESGFALFQQMMNDWKTATQTNKLLWHSANADYRLRIIEEADRCSTPDEKITIPLREGLYSLPIADLTECMAQWCTENVLANVGQSTSNRKSIR